MAGKISNPFRSTFLTTRIYPAVWKRKESVLSCTTTDKKKRRKRRSETSQLDMNLVPAWGAHSNHSHSPPIHSRRDLSRNSYSTIRYTSTSTLKRHLHLAHPDDSTSPTDEVERSSLDKIQSTTPSPTLTRTDLQKLTVKVLKDKLKQLHTPIKISQLKLKEDIIDFLLEQFKEQEQTFSIVAQDLDSLNRNQSTQHENPATSHEKSHPIRTETNIPMKTRIKRMPPMTDRSVFSSPTNSNTTLPSSSLFTSSMQFPNHTLSSSSSSSSPVATSTSSIRTTTTTTTAIKSHHYIPTKNVSPKDAIFEQVLLRYPPLRELQVAIANYNNHNPTIHGNSDRNLPIPIHTPPHPEATNNNNNNNTSSSSLLASFTHPSSIKSFTGFGEFDIRHIYHPMMIHTSSSDFDVVMVGTASCVPGVTRGVSCTALRMQWRRNIGLIHSESEKRKTTDLNQNHQVGEDERKQNNMKQGRGDSSLGTTDTNKNVPITTVGTWIFDCGESTQLQIQRTGSIRPGKITKIFITHSHGDHSFGLPGLLCLMGQDRDREGPPLDIYGPEGLRMWLRAAIRYSVSRIVPPYRVHEIKNIPMGPEWIQSRNGRYYYGGRQAQRQQSWATNGFAGEDPVSWITRAPLLDLEPSSQFGEVSDGRDIFPIYDHPKCVDGAPIWEIEDAEDVKVYAAPMSHGVPCVGYVVEEETKSGRLKSELVEPILLRNIEALKKSGMKAPMKVMALIKELPVGGSYTFPDGCTVYRDEVVEPPIKGRKVVICGDTADARALAGLAQGADLLIHEATNAYLSGVDKDTNQEEVTNDAKIHGHSTPFMAGDFAKRIGAKRLLLTHFSSRYKGDQSLESMSIMTRIEKQAMQASGLSEDRVAAAWDLMTMPIPRN